MSRDVAIRIAKKKLAAARSSRSKAQAALKRAEERVCALEDEVDELEYAELVAKQEAADLLGANGITFRMRRLPKTLFDEKVEETFVLGHIDHYGDMFRIWARQAGSVNGSSLFCDVSTKRHGRFCGVGHHWEPVEETLRDILQRDAERETGNVWAWSAREMLCSTQEETA